ncbi:hypothetical protein, partial [Salmonella sp. s54234]|uniref:hypothetical protein n=1 Tax=Salmonella sp. s54234 TaxID=3159663 RepID=UPI00397F4FE6
TDGNLNLQSGNTHNVGSLVLDSGSNVNAALGVALAGDPALVSVAGDLTLGGNLNITNLGGFGAGVYRLASYAGNLTNNGLSINSLPSGININDTLVQTA